jgi:hypothetical protein
MYSYEYGDTMYSYEYGELYGTVTVISQNTTPEYSSITTKFPRIHRSYVPKPNAVT